MSIIRIFEPTNFPSALRQIPVWATSTRGTPISLAITSVTDEGGGNIGLVHASNFILEAGDIITLSNMTVGAYDGRHEVISDSGTKTIIEFDFTATATGDLDRTNDNLRMRIELFGGYDNISLGEVTRFPDEISGAQSIFKFNIEGFVRKLFSGDLIDNTTVEIFISLMEDIAPANTRQPVNFILTEVFDDVDGVQKDGDVDNEQVDHVFNGDFTTNDDGWDDPDNGWAFFGSKLRSNPLPDPNITTQANQLYKGRLYTMNFDVSNDVSGGTNTITVTYGGRTFAITGIGNKNDVAPAVSTDRDIVFETDDPVNSIDIDNVVVTGPKEYIINTIAAQQTESQDLDGVWIIEQGMDAGTGKFLTNAPNTRRLKGLSILNGNAMDMQLYIDVFTNWELLSTPWSLNAAGSGIASSDFTNTTAKVAALVAAMDALSDPLTPDFISLQVDLRDADNGFAVVATQWVGVVHSNCGDAIQLTWRNRVDGMDYRVFNVRNTLGLTSKQSNFEKSLPLNFNVEDRGRTTLSVRAGNTLTVGTGFVHNDILEWLQELITSPEVYMYSRIVTPSFPDDIITYERVPVTMVDYSGGISDSMNTEGLAITFRVANDLVIQGI